MKPEVGEVWEPKAPVEKVTVESVNKERGSVTFREFPGGRSFMVSMDGFLFEFRPAAGEGAENGE